MSASLALQDLRLGFYGVEVLRGVSLDIAAGSLIAERAGAVVTDMTGAALRFNTPTAVAAGVLALPQGPHAEALARLTGA